MRLTVTHQIAHEDRRLLQAFLERQRDILAAITRLENNVMTILDDIQAKQAIALEKLTKNTDLDAAIKTAFDAKDAVIVDLRAQLAAASGDPVKLQAILDTMDAIIAAQDNDTLVSATLANTEAAPA